jgi:hypothetical protein
VGNTDGMKRIIFVLRTFSVGKSIGNNIFLLPTYLPMGKKLPMKELSMEHFCR